MQNGGGDPARCLLDRLEAVTAADTATHDVELVETEMVDEGEMIGGEGVPAMVGPDVGERFAGVALIHGDGGTRNIRLATRVSGTWARFAAR